MTSLLQTGTSGIVKPYSWSSRTYLEAFHAFVHCTDQKISAIQRIAEVALQLPNNNLFIDAGSGSGYFSFLLEDLFDSCIALEPNPFFAEETRKRCRGVKVLPVDLFAFRAERVADFVLCSHVLFHMPEQFWISATLQMMSWLRPGGELCILLQSSDTDCRRLLRHFGFTRSNLGCLRQKLVNVVGNVVECRLERLESYIEAPNIETAFIVSEFMINEVTGFGSIAATELIRFIEREFRCTDGQYRFTCDQDVLRIRQETIGEAGPDFFEAMFQTCRL